MYHVYGDLERCAQKASIRVLSIDPGYISMGIRIDTWERDSPRVVADLYEIGSFGDPPWVPLTDYLREAPFEGIDLLVIENQPPLKGINLRTEQHAIAMLMAREVPVVHVEPRLRNTCPEVVELSRRQGVSAKEGVILAGEAILARRADQFSLAVLDKAHALRNAAKRKKTLSDLCDPLVQVHELFNGERTCFLETALHWPPMARGAYS